MPNVLSPRDIVVFRPDLLDKTGLSSSTHPSVVISWLGEPPTVRPEYAVHVIGKTSYSAESFKGATA